MLNDPFLDIRINSVRALIYYGDLRDPRIEKLHSFLIDECVILRRLAARNIVENGPNDTTWSILLDAARNDATEFHTWVDGLVISLEHGFGETTSLDSLRSHVVAFPEIFDPDSFLCARHLTDLWVDEIVNWPGGDDWDWLHRARGRFDDRVRLLQSGNTYVNMIDDALRRIQDTK